MLKNKVISQNLICLIILVFFFQGKIFSQQINGLNLGASPESYSAASDGELYPILSSAEAEREGGLKDNLLSTGNRLKFADYLFQQEDYLRALNEYREFLRYEDNDSVRYRLAESFFRIGRFNEAADNFKGLFFGSDLSDEAILGFYKSSFFKGNYKEFRELTATPIYMPDKYVTEINRLYFISHFMDNTLPYDTAKLFTAFPDSNRQEVKNFYRSRKFSEYKSPVTAALLSVAIPGLGKVYAGEVGDGITSFITTGLLVFLSVNNFDHDHNFRGWLFAGMAALSYGGTIYGSAASAQIYNAGIKFNLDNEIKLYFEKRNYFLPKLEF
ncbi:MAG: tetratricopeptide repeat protein [Bacteroidota bacterium]